MTLMPPFEKFIKNPYPGRLITFDPGETTGFTIWDNMKLVESNHLNTYEVKTACEWLPLWLSSKVLGSPLSVHVRMEEYRIYSWKSEQHAWSTVHTIRLIGALECLCVQLGISYDMCGAGLAKTFATDAKLKEWGFYKPAHRHANDAIRHAVNFYCTPPKK